MGFISPWRFDSSQAHCESPAYAGLSSFMAAESPRSHRVAGTNRAAIDPAGGLREWLETRRPLNKGEQTPADPLAEVRALWAL